MFMSSPDDLAMAATGELLDLQNSHLSSLSFIESSDSKRFRSQGEVWDMRNWEAVTVQHTGQTSKYLFKPHKAGSSTNAVSAVLPGFPGPAEPSKHSSEPFQNQVQTNHLNSPSPRFP